MKKWEILLPLVCLMLCCICLIVMAYLIFLLCQLNSVFMAVVKFLGKVFCELQLHYIVMPGSIMAGEVCLCPLHAVLVRS